MPRGRTWWSAPPCAGSGSGASPATTWSVPSGSSSRSAPPDGRRPRGVSSTGSGAGVPTIDGELSAAEKETARLASEGMPNKAIARQLQVSVSTVEAHLTKAYAKLGVRSRAQLAVRLEELGRG